MVYKDIVLRSPAALAGMKNNIIGIIINEPYPGQFIVPLITSFLTCDKRTLFHTDT